MSQHCIKLFILFFLISIVSLSQQMPLGFSEVSNSFTPFGGSGFSFSTDPSDSSNDVGQFFNDGSDPWQGFFLDLSRAIDLDFQKTISLSFYASDPNAHTVMLKLENGVNPSVEVSQAVNGTGWTTNVSFDFSNAVLSSDGVTSVNASGIYNRITVFIDGGVYAAGTYLIDDIDDGSIPTDPNALDVIYNDLVWADEFDTNGAVNSSNWHHQTLLPAGGSWFNGEQQHYTNRIENSSVTNGFLSITAKKETFTDQGQTKSYTSARLNSKFAFTYGRVDVRAKLPLGEGTWPAIWTLGKNVNENGGYWYNDFGTTNWPACGEIDIMEHGLGAVNHVSSALHTPCSGCFGNTKNVMSKEISDVANNFHIYSLNWSPNQITFLIDGVGYYTYNPSIKDSGTWPFFEDQYLLLNVAMGGIAGTIDPNFVESSMEIDYVRVYQNTSLSTYDNYANNFGIYPNPVTNNINIATSETIDRIVVYDILGNIILKSPNNTKIIDASGFKSGIYILSIYSGFNKVVKKIVVN